MCFNSNIKIVFVLITNKSILNGSNHKLEALKSAENEIYRLNFLDDFHKIFKIYKDLIYDIEHFEIY